MGWVNLINEPPLIYPLSWQHEQTLAQLPRFPGDNGVWHAEQAVITPISFEGAATRKENGASRYLGILGEVMPWEQVR